MKLCNNVCNRCRLVCEKFYLNLISFAVVIAKCLGGSLFWDTLYNKHSFCLTDLFFNGHYRQGQIHYRHPSRASELAKQKQILASITLPL